MKINATSIITILLFMWIPTRADIWYVHPDSVLNSIQTGLNSCSSGDTVLVAPGVYTENIAWPCVTGVSLFSESGPNNTIIDGDYAATVVYFSGVANIDTTTIIRGFTIREGYSEYYGGGIHCDSSSPLIEDNILWNNRSSGAGGGISCNMFSSPIINSNQIIFNLTFANGGGIHCYYYSSPTITNNQIIDNDAMEGGGGIYCESHSNPTITGNEIDSNGGGISCYEYSDPYISGNQITKSPYNGGIYCESHSSPEITGNEIDSNAGSGISCYEYSSPYISGNQITNNTAGWGGGIRCNEYSNPHIFGNQITNNTAEWEGDGIHCDNHSSPSINGNTITENRFYSTDSGIGIYCRNSSFPVVDSNNIYDNGYGAYNVDTSQYLLAEYNWWGDATGPYHPTFNPGGMGDAISDYVNFYPWLTDSVSVGAEEQTTRITVRRSDFRAALFSGPLRLPEGIDCRVFDITGRVVAPDKMRPGIYFIEIDEQITQKVVKIR